MPVASFSQFESEYRAERMRRLRASFLWYCGVTAIVTLLALVIFLMIGFFGSRPSFVRAAMPLISFAFMIVLYAGAFAYMFVRPRPRDRVLRLVIGLIVIGGAVGLLTPGVGNDDVNDAAFTWKLQVNEAMLNLLVVHLLACLFLPLYPREAILPLIPLLFLFAGVSIGAVIGEIVDTRTAILMIGISPVMGLPGVFICWYRSRAFRREFMLGWKSTRFDEISDELAGARKIHESLFPEPLQAGGIAFDYVYRPMAEIGGDFVFVRPTMDENDNRPVALSVVMIDVTGHGITSAITVNRLFGELERIFAEQPDASPAHVMTLMNRYIALTMTRYSVYATGFACRVDVASGAMRWVSAGHTPTLLCRADGGVEQLERTASMLGALEPKFFSADEQTGKLEIGDHLMVYTDGVLEARDQRGEELGADGLRKMLKQLDEQRASDAAPSTWAQALATRVDAYRFGPPMDDALIVDVHVTALEDASNAMTDEATPKEVVEA